MPKNKLTITQESFVTMLPKLIESGVTFDANEIDGMIVVVFTGGY